MSKILKRNRSWIDDGLKEPKWYIALGMIILFYVGNILSDSLSVQVVSWLHSEYTPNSEAFLAFLRTEPWSGLVVRVLWVILYFLLAYALGLRFFKLNSGIKKMLVIITVALCAHLFIQVLSAVTGSGETANQAILNQSIREMSWPKLLISYVAIAAFSEEIAMRGLVMRYLLPHYPVVGILLSAYLFGSMHFTTNWFHASLYFIAGLINAIAYYKTNRLQVPIIIHAIVNAVVLWTIVK